MRPDLVLGVSAASATLAQLTLRRPVGPGAGPGHRLRRAEPAPGPARRDGRGHRPEPAGAATWPGSPSRSTGSRSTSAHGDLYAAGRRRAVRPDHHQPAVRDVPARATRAADLPRGRRPRRRAGRAGGRRGRRRTWPRTACCRCWATGPTSAARTGPTGSRGWLAAHRLRRARGPARGARPAAYVEVWLADAGLAGSPGVRRPVRRLAGLLRPAAASRRWAWAG